MNCPASPPNGSLLLRPRHRVTAQAAARVAQVTPRHIGSHRQGRKRQAATGSKRLGQRVEYNAPNAFLTTAAASRTQPQPSLKLVSGAATLSSSSTTLPRAFTFTEASMELKFAYLCGLVLVVACGDSRPLPTPPTPTSPAPANPTPACPPCPPPGAHALSGVVRVGGVPVVGATVGLIQLGPQTPIQRAPKT